MEENSDRLVMKFGGTSVGDLERIERVARHVRAEIERGRKVCVTVSAMSGETNRLVDLTEKAGGGDVSRTPDYDAVVSTGEQVTAGLLALVLQRQGIRARSWQGWQAGLRTDDSHGAAVIEDIDGETLGAAIDTGEIAVVSGFQGVSPDGRISTLGRGGSDTTAVALAAALGAFRCDIYTDVDGVYTTDPRIVPGARRLDRISFEEMLEMASLGAKVLQTRSVGLGMTHNVPIRVLSSLEEPQDDPANTLITSEEHIMERRVVSAVVPSRAEAKISLLGVPNTPGKSATIFAGLASAKVNIDMIVQSQARAGEAANVSFTLKEADLSRALSHLAEMKDEVGYTDVIADQNVSKVSIIGVGMNDTSGVAAQMFRTLAERGINIQNISTSEIKISVLIPAEYTELAVRALHDAFELGTVGAAGAGGPRAFV
ncbi:aspartate kinase [Parvularcula dongshanensis]|uniref:Aspartokinase n=1 Tax=Parvularcula dongshanensis TaxID=1173995 RepID=A0A840HXX5_9PROT|nr:aspartate kinase [Parvularcula dongshanensis]MBB4657696.1 aspartate kinase [Parvularcula dongshanensis]